jgi:hypothetical protein
MLKIRRLMLEKLFLGWVTETRDLRMVRYKASMILSRMVRRTKGPLWVKEATLVCFHMWFRYIQVKVRSARRRQFVRMKRVCSVGSLCSPVRAAKCWNTLW